MTVPTPTRRTGPVGVRTGYAVAALAVATGLVACGHSSTTAHSSATTPSVAAPAAGSASAATSSTATKDVVRSGSGATKGPASNAVPGPAATATRVARALQPVRIRIPAIGVDASLVDLGIAGDGAIEVPTDTDQAGWLDTTSAPGQQGPAVIAGHVDSKTGPAVFYRLRSLHVGDVVTVVRRNGTTVTFSVDGVQQHPKSAFPSQETYGPVPGPALRLITCGGTFNRSTGHYDANVVVFAS